MSRHPSYIPFSRRHNALMNPQLLMSKKQRKFLKNIFTYLPDSHFLRSVTWAPRIRKWKKKFVGTDTPEFDDRMDLFDHVIKNHIHSSFVFLEFGCASGNVIKYWAEQCPDSNNRFVGFDTFTGLPEKWRGLTWSVDAGTWDLEGNLPVVSDQRVDFVKGTFQSTLPGFLSSGLDLESFPQKIIAIDGDLYSSAMVALCRLIDHLDNAIVIFDEFDCVLDEFRALDDLCSIFDLSFDVLGTTDWCDQVAVRIKFPKGNSSLVNNRVEY